MQAIMKLCRDNGDINMRLIWFLVASVLTWQSTTVYGQQAPNTVVSIHAPTTQSPIIQELLGSKDWADITVRLNAIDSAIFKLVEQVSKMAVYGQQAPGTIASNQGPVTQGLIVQELLGSKDWAEINVRFNTIDSAISKLNERVSRTTVYLPAGIGFLGVLVGTIITFLSQQKLLKHQQILADKAAAHDTELADKRVNVEIASSFAQWQLKQLSELYGPLHALFRQSNEIYRHMNTVLVGADPEKFRLLQGNASDDFDGKIFEIFLDGQWVCFRTIMHIGEVYGRNYGIEDYFDEVVAIGGRIANVIVEKAGYVRPEPRELASVFGKYLAHYSVLNRLHTHTQAKYSRSTGNSDSATQADDMFVEDIAVDEAAVFPREINRLVDLGFDALNRELNEWRRA
jgi:hypothetical protein